MKNVNLAILGATGAVGTEMLKVLAERNFPVGELLLLADSNDAGKEIVFQSKKYVVQEAKKDSFSGVEVLFVAVSDAVSKIFTPEAVRAGAVVIDNSNAYRLEKDVPLVVPEVNGADVACHKGIIANPNCSTIIALMAVNAIYKRSRIVRMTASTYQAVSGAGILGISELQQQARQVLDEENIKPSVFQHQIAFNVIPHIDVFQPNGYTKEEMKLVSESRKILHDDDIKISATCVRVPVFRSHSEAISVETAEKISAEEAKELIKAAPGVKLVDDVANNVYPMPKDTGDQDLVYVGRIREDISAKNSLVLWCCGDQIRKGAATNAVQIAELLQKEI